MLRSTGRSVSASLVATALLCGICRGSSGQADSPREQAAALAKRAKKALKDSKNAEAYLFYSEAAAVQPNNKKLKQKMEALQSRAALASKASPTTGPESAAIDPSLLPPSIAP